MIKHLNLMLIALTVISLISCKHVSTSEESSKVTISDTFAKYIAIDTVKTKQVEGELTLTGKITFDENRVARIFPLTGGIILNMKVQLGDYVKKGQLLAVMKSIEGADYSNQLIAAESNLNIASKNAASAKKLFNDGLMSEKELSNANDEQKKAEGELQRIKGIMNILGEDANQTISIKAPASGFIVEKNAAENMEFRSDNPNPLFTIANLDKVYVIANVFESDIAKVSMGNQAMISVISYPDHTFKGKIDKIYNVIDPNTKVMNVRICLDNPKLMLKPEMFANIQILYPENKTMNYIPSSALIFDRNSNWVVVYHSKDSVEARQVKVYKAFGNNTYISEGIKENELIISRKALLLYDALNGD
jgi:cobalt-zinc-cadmium efflux system membrane fusion protein